jgi:hypothetical protein
MSARRGTEQFEELTAGYGLIFVSKNLQNLIHRVHVTASNPRLSEQMLQRIIPNAIEIFWSGGLSDDQNKRVKRVQAIAQLVIGIETCQPPW